MSESSRQYPCLRSERYASQIREGQALEGEFSVIKGVRTHMAQCVLSATFTIFSFMHLVERSILIYTPCFLCISLHLLQDFSPQFWLSFLLHHTPSNCPQNSSISACQITAFPYWPGRPHNSRLHLYIKTQQLNERQICGLKKMRGMVMKVSGVATDSQ